MRLSGYTAVRTAALLVACLVAPMAAGRAIAQTAPQLTIASAAVLDGENRITIAGKHFGTEVPAVKLGDASLSIISSSETEIVAEVPALVPGSYVLAVSRDGGATPEGSASLAVIVRSPVVGIGSLANMRVSVTNTRGMR